MQRLSLRRSAQAGWIELNLSGSWEHTDSRWFTVIHGDSRWFTVIHGDSNHTARTGWLRWGWLNGWLGKDAVIESLSFFACLLHRWYLMVGKYRLALIVLGKHLVRDSAICGRGWLRQCMCWVRPLERLEEPPLGPHKFFPREDSANLSMSDLSLSLYIYVYIYIHVI